MEVVSAIQKLCGFFAQWEMRVSIRAMSRRRVRSRAGFSNWALACCRRRLKISCRRFAAIGQQFLQRLFSEFFALYFHNHLTRSVPGNKFGFNGQLGGGQAQGFAGHRLGDAIDFKQDVGGTDNGHPGLERAFAFAHSSFQWLFGEGFLRENPNPHFAVALHIAGDGNAGGFDLLGIEPATFQRHASHIRRKRRCGRAWPSPARLPRCILRYLTLSGINGIIKIPRNQIELAMSLGRNRDRRRRLGVWFHLCKSSI